MIKTIARIYEKQELWQQQVARDISLITDEVKRTTACAYYGEVQPREFKLSEAEAELINREILSIIRFVKAAKRIPDKSLAHINSAQERLEKPLALPSKRTLQMKSIEGENISLTTRP